MPLLRDVKDQLGSAYLLDHVDNPVEWRTWSEATLLEAATSDRPVFLSVGYAACHWCHVMAHESFEDVGIAAYLNEHFIPVKVDREERPDVDALYMAATQLISGQGGWPMSVFLLPDGRPFMAGTYYPPVDRGGHVGFARLLEALQGAWENQRALVEEQADGLSSALEREVRFVDHLVPYDETIDLAAVRGRLRDELLERVDADGGFGGAPKFPRPSYVDALVDFTDDASRDAVTRTLDAMSRRGLYDHFGGGFARYSTDAVWHVPHFEKMLCDQALLARCYLDAARRYDHPAWHSVALDTLDFVERDLLVEGGFASSLDADANGVEGSHVTWTTEEVTAALNRHHLEGDVAASLRRWRIEARGTFEGRSIPRLADGEPFVTPAALEGAHQALIATRATRPQPGRDGKVILEWNAMIVSALLRSGEPRFESRGYDLLSSLARTHFHDDTWWRTERREAHASASDVAWLIDAMVDAFEASGEHAWLESAGDLASFLLTHYWDGERPTVADPDRGGGVFSQSDLVRDLATRPKEIFDGATPSAHAVATRALARLALCRGETHLLVVAQRLVTLAASLLVSHPSAVPDLVAAAGYALEGVEVVIPGEPGALARHVRSMAMPRTVLITGRGHSPLLAGREEGLAYVCRGGVCERPVSTRDELDTRLRASVR
jgi:uncharacterized protein YyaL (SSP411 family)